MALKVCMSFEVNNCFLASALAELRCFEVSSKRRSFVPLKMKSYKSRRKPNKNFCDEAGRSTSKFVFFESVRFSQRVSSTGQMQASQSLVENQNHNQKQYFDKILLDGPQTLLLFQK